MTPFTILHAIACPLPRSNVDTDQLIPARFMKRSRAQGYGGFLLHDLRFDEKGAEKSDCPLAAPERQGARILVSRRNFGGGSSREAAVYALIDYGIACVVAPSFGDIFAANAVNNGLLPATVDEADGEAILRYLAQGGLMLSVDLENLTLCTATSALPFTIDPVWRTKLLNGWDDIALTHSHAMAIAAFVKKDQRRRPWTPPRKARGEGD